MRFIAVIIAFITVLPIRCFCSGSPWKWVGTMSRDSSGVHIKMPCSIYYDRDLDRYYVVDSGNNRLLSFNSNFKFLKEFDAGGQLNLPVSMLRERNGDLWVVERGANSLTHIEMKKRKIHRNRIKLPGGSSVFPDRLSMGNGGVLYLLDRSSGKILALGKDLSVSKVYLDPEGGHIVDFKLKRKGIWALEPMKRMAVLFSYDGKVIRRVALRSAPGFPVSLDVDSIGFLYVLERFAGRIDVFDPDGRFRYSFLGRGQSRSRLYYPSQIIFDSSGRLCIVEEGNGRVEVFRR